MPDLYLIAHKVRGEPAFDIAHRLKIGDEEGWIIPTSGHRAYPYWKSSLEDVLVGDGWFKAKVIEEMPHDLPDHYSTSASPKSSSTPLFDRLGFKRPEPPKVTRRI